MSASAGVRGVGPDWKLGQAEKHRIAAVAIAAGAIVRWQRQQWRAGTSHNGRGHGRRRRRRRRRQRGDDRWVRGRSRSDRGAIVGDPEPNTRWGNTSAGNGL